MSKIAVVGSANTDMTVQVQRMPGPGETVLGGTFHEAAGGKGANQAIAAARAGGAVTFVACIGDDLLGERAIEGFRAEGINTDFVRKVSDVPTGVALILVDDAGENSIAVAPGANACLSPALVQKAKPAIAEADVLVVQLETPLETVRTVAEMAAVNGTEVILNPAPAQHLDSNLLEHVSVITPNESEATLLTDNTTDGESRLEGAAQLLLSKGAKAVLITLGARGVRIITPNVQERVPAFEVNVVDTTAAGDVFSGALAVARAEKKPLREAAQFANAAAALSVQTMGAQPSAPLRKDILKLMEHGRRRHSPSVHGA